MQQIVEKYRDTGDTATGSPVGININSGKGGMPVRGAVISRNIIREEGLDIAINTPANVDVHLNDLLRGVLDDVCLLDVGTGGMYRQQRCHRELLGVFYRAWRADAPSAAGMRVSGI